MNSITTDSSRISLSYRLFVAIKYLTYGLLAFNIYLFLQQETASASYSLSTDFDLPTLIQLFSATLDTAAWVLLLLLFELETAVISDEKLVGLTKLSIHGVRLICGLAICSAFVGYWGEFTVFTQTAALPAAPCDLVTQGWSVLLDFDRFEPLTAANCSALGADARAIPGLDQVLASSASFESAFDLALVDVVNAAAWILVVVLLEVEVRLQLLGGVPLRIQWFMNAFKVVLYLTLALAAVYWGFEGEFLDFWDAALWLFAFVFIELNVFQWQQELDSKEAVAPTP